MRLGAPPLTGYHRPMTAQPHTIELDASTVSGLWQAPPSPTAVLALAHGAGAGMTHRSMAAIADGLEARGVATLFAGGRSFGGRMTSQAQALAPLPGVRGLIFFAFPLHPAGKPGVDRA